MMGSVKFLLKQERNHTMRYVVIDLEFNQPFDFPKGRKTLLEPLCPCEIIQIGAVRMDENFQIIDTCDFLINPTVYKRIHPFVNKITGLDMEMLSGHETFPDVFAKFVEFAGEPPYIFCVWGGNDIHELFGNAEYHKLDTAALSGEYIDVQALASVKMNLPSGMNVGLKNAVEGFGLAGDAPFHYALNDAVYTAEIFALVHTDEMKVQRYQTIKVEGKNFRFSSQPLFRFVEKELGRKLSKKEKSLYKKVYELGREKRFEENG